MSTNSSITAKCSDGKWRCIYCHWDGYPEHNGRILVKHFNETSKVDKLMALGSLSVLGEKCDAPKGHNFDCPADGVCIAYHRDRGDDLMIGVGNSAQEALENNNCGAQEYNYMFDGEKWLVNYEFDDKGAVSVEQFLAEQEK